MKISEFARQNNVTAKMLRHYDELGLLKPEDVDGFTGYRIYSQKQAQRLNWIIILKNLDFSLREIAELLNNPVDAVELVGSLRVKRSAIAQELNLQISKMIQIDRLILLMEREGFTEREDLSMYINREVNLMDMPFDAVNEIKKRMPNNEMFLDKAKEILAALGEGDSVVIIRMDLWHFKSVNDDYGFEVGDKVIVAFYQMLEESLAEAGVKATMCRAGGDEYLAFFAGGQEEAKQVAERMTAEASAYDYARLGCSKKLGCYLGAVVKPVKGMTLREAISETHEIMGSVHKREVYMNSFEIR